jgi:hypothetical protein
LILVPKNWDTFQHYKDRNPPWVKLHKSLLDDRAFMSLPLACKALAPLLWLLASESKSGEFDASIEELEFRLRIPAKEIESGLKALINKGFFIVACDTLADASNPHTFAVPETEERQRTETEKETKTETRKLAPPEGVSIQVWDDFVKSRKAKFTQTALDGIQREANKAGWSLEDALRECCARGWRGFKADWVQQGQTAQDKKREVMSGLTRGLVSGGGNVKLLA